VVRDPPRKPEQACRAVWGSRRQRAQPRRPNKCGAACIERRQRNGRRQRHRLRIPSTQRKRLRRILGDAEPCPGSPGNKVRWRHRHTRYVRVFASLRSCHQINGHRQVKRREPREEGSECMKEEELPFKGACNLSFIRGNISCPLWTEDEARNGLVRSGYEQIIWIRYLFNSFKPDYWNRYTLCSRMDQTLALVGCNTTHRGPDEPFNHLVTCIHIMSTPLH
jgi:hypothetical protein